ncbi:hypothetical protein QBC47DRAFT_402222 [Echria macrotheca]|uniref:Uncharacterized protein n=1 Tax=Echria macrotheca TaxID=438768 RepID=A0AAJ0BDP4_9PEZI|nr:hypothetical protein QBC47DRAFT_402222 [Echria macrotheca]
MILFETTESVVEILYDVALAIFILRLALIYFLLNFASALLLSYLSLANYTPITHLITLSSSGILIPFLLASATLWARVLIVRYEIPRAGWFRLGIGAVALVLMVLAEGVVGVVLYEEGWWRDGEVWERLVGGASGDGQERRREWIGLVGVLAWYALMPWCLMFFEGVDEVSEVEVVKREPVPVSEKMPVEGAKN